MEDDKSTTTVSTNEDELDTEVELEDIEVELEDQDSEDDETEATEESEGDESANESTDETEEESAEDTNNDEQAEAPADPNAERRAAQEAYKQRQAAREAAKHQAQEDYVDRGYQKAYEEAIDAGKDERTARHEAEQAETLNRLKVEAYNNRIQGNTNKLQNDMDKATARIDLFQSKDPAVKEALLEAVDDFERMHVKLDRNGDPVEVTGDLYDFLQKRADRIRQLTGIRAQRAEQDKKKLKSRTMTTPARTPKQVKDKDLDDFDKAWDE